MRRTPLVAALVVALLAGAPLVQARVTQDPASPHREAVVADYISTYTKAHEKLGAEAVGRNLAVDGYNDPHEGVRTATTTELQESLEKLRPMLHPPAPAALEAASTSSGYSIPEAIVMCESGGDYTAVNPSSGAGGAYQILPSTWELYGQSGAPQDAPPALQDQVAAEIWADSGGSAWVCAA